MIVSAIVATAANRVIGKNNELPWHLPADLQYFKQTTLHRTVVMGRNSFESLGRPLPNRINMVVTRNPFYAATGCQVFHSVEEALAGAEAQGETECFILGGGEIFRQSMPYWDKLYLTDIEADIEGDVYFPEVNYAEWTEISADRHIKDDKNVYNFTFRVFARKKQRNRLTG